MAICDCGHEQDEHGPLNGPCLVVENFGQTSCGCEGFKRDYDSEIESLLDTNASLRRERDQLRETLNRQAEVVTSVADVAVWSEDKPSPEPTPEEILMDAFREYLHHYLAHNGYAPVD